MLVEYLAGFFDGEGSIGAYSTKSNPHGILMVTIAQNDPVPLDLFRSRYGGTIVRDNRKCHLLKLNGAKAARLLRDLEPYMIVKNREARLALQFQELIGTGPDNYPERTRLMSEIKDLKGHHHVAA